MKITYEPGDIVEVEDNMNAGRLAAETVELIEKKKKFWTAKIVNTDGPIYKVEEIYLQP